jgi:hypothetical protein
MSSPGYVMEVVKIDSHEEHALRHYAMQSDAEDDKWQYRTIGQLEKVYRALLAYRFVGYAHAFPLEYIRSPFDATDHCGEMRVLQEI